MLSDGVSIVRWRAMEDHADAFVLCTLPGCAEFGVLRCCWLARRCGLDLLDAETTVFPLVRLRAWGGRVEACLRERGRATGRDGPAQTRTSPVFKCGAIRPDTHASAHISDTRAQLRAISTVCRRIRCVISARKTGLGDLIREQLTARRGPLRVYWPVLAAMRVLLTVTGRIVADALTTRWFEELKTNSQILIPDSQLSSREQISTTRYAKYLPSNRKSPWLCLSL